MHASLLTTCDARLPRYTSYPTAPHFHAGIDGPTYAGWLADLPADLPLSLYLHVPFCQRLCWYCGCNTTIVSRYQPVAGFVERLLREVDLAAAVLGPHRPVTHVHFGGGTPTILMPDDWQSLRTALDRRFAIAEDAELAVEGDPRSLDDATVRALAAAGVNRASLGVQDFDPAVQAAVNRLQPYPLVADAIDRLRAAGIQRINLDLIYGLPLQTAASFAATLDAVAALAPDRVAVFGYAHVPWMKPHQRVLERHPLPDTTARWQLAALARDKLVGAGYVPIGLDHFARPDDPLAEAAAAGCLHRNFQGYTDDAAPALVGLGPSAVSALPQGYAQAASDLTGWSAAVDRGAFATVRGIALTRDDRLRRAVIERLMCDLAVDLDAVAEDFGLTAHAFAQERARLAALERDGLVRLAGDRVTVTDLGRPLVRAVAAAFDRYLAMGKAQHARVV